MSPILKVELTANGKGYKIVEGVSYKKLSVFWGEIYVTVAQSDAD